MLEDTNSVVAWVFDGGIALQTACDTLKDKVFEDYRRWCFVNAMREVSVVQFWKRMHEHFKELQEARIRVDGVQRRVCNLAFPAGTPLDSGLLGLGPFAPRR